MNPYQIVGIIAGCSLVFASVVALLAMQGLPVMIAFLLVYAVALVSMVGMQRRAHQSCEEAEHESVRRGPASGTRVPRPPRPPRSVVSLPTDAEPASAGVGDVGVRY